MVENRLYNKENKRVGTLYMNANRDIVGLQFPRYSKLREDFLKCINNFLKKNKLKPVSSLASFRKHCNYNKYKINMKGIDMYYKYNNPKTAQVEIKPISPSQPNKSEVGK